MTTSAKKKGDWMTAEELMAQLESDPEWVKQRDERDRIHAEKVAQNIEDAKPLIAALREAGVSLNSLNDVIQVEKLHPAVIPVLLEHLDREKSEYVRGSMALALAVPEAIVGWSKIKTAFLNDPKPTTDVSRTKWQWALALGAIANDSMLDEVIDLLKNPAHGRDRVPLIQVLLRSKESRAKKVLEELESDPVIGKDAKMARKKGRWPWSK